MTRTRQTIIVVPGARRLIRSLRDLGYEPAEAIADVVDNSIAADARNVDITVHFSGDESWIRIADDGWGMDGTEITEAMRYGTERDYDDDDLGKFGLGLKTASMSQCRRLTVASRVSPDRARIEARQLDLDLVEETNDWDIVILRASERPEQVVEPLEEHRGTVVLWEDLDRILTYQDPSGGWARRYLMDLAEIIEEHLAMVFHRFLAGEVRGRKLSMTINGNPVEPWDPFARAERETEHLKKEEYPLSTPYGSGIVHLQPYVLPPKSSFSSTAAWQRAAGPRNWNAQQGFYIYRADRLIQSGGWSRTRVVDEHTKLARVALLFPPALDAAFGINVAKMRVALPPELKELVKDPVDRAVRHARVVYNAKPDLPKKPGGAGPKRRGGNGPGGGNDADGGGSGGNGALTGTPTERRAALEAAARAVAEGRALRRIAEELGHRSPEIAKDLGW
jgi:hypothetical protein